MSKVFNTITGYRDADYDIDNHIDKTASFPDGLHENYTCVPGSKPKVRLTSSSADISRFYRYFELAQSNSGRFFTWKHYLKILQDELRHLDTLITMTKMTLRSISSPLNSELSNYETASEFEESSLKKSSVNIKRRRRLFHRKEAFGGDNGSISSVDTISLGAVSQTPQTNLLKKMCSDISSLIRKTCRTVEKISTKSKYCPACGDAKDYPKPLTPTSMKNILVRSRSMTFDYHMNTPVGEGETPTTSRPPRLPFEPHTGCRMKPFTKRILADN